MIVAKGGRPQLPVQLIARVLTGRSTPSRAPASLSRPGHLIGFGKIIVSSVWCKGIGIEPQDHVYIKSQSGNKIGFKGIRVEIKRFVFRITEIEILVLKIEYGSGHGRFKYRARRLNLQTGLKLIVGIAVHGDKKTAVDAVVFGQSPVAPPGFVE